MGEELCGGCNEIFVGCVHEIGCFVTREASRGQGRLVKKFARIT